MESDAAERSQKLREWKARKHELESFKAKKLAARPKWGSTVKLPKEKLCPLAPSNRSNRLSLDTTPQKPIMKTPAKTPSHYSQSSYHSQLATAQELLKTGDLAKAEAIYSILWSTPFSELALNDAAFWDGWFQASSKSPEQPLPDTQPQQPASAVISEPEPTQTLEAEPAKVPEPTLKPKPPMLSLPETKAPFFSPRKNLVQSKYRPSLGTPRTMAAKRAELLGLRPSNIHKSLTPIADRLRRELEQVEEAEGKRREESHRKNWHACARTSAAKAPSASKMLVFDETAQETSQKTTQNTQETTQKEQPILTIHTTTCEIAPISPNSNTSQLNTPSSPRATSPALNTTPKKQLDLNDSTISQASELVTPVLSSPPDLQVHLQAPHAASQPCSTIFLENEAMEASSALNLPVSPVRQTSTSDDALTSSPSSPKVSPRNLAESPQRLPSPSSPQVKTTAKKLTKRKSLSPAQPKDFVLPPWVETRQDPPIIHTLFWPTFTEDSGDLLNDDSVALEAVRVKNLRKSTQQEISNYDPASDMILSPVRRSARRKSVQTPEEISSLLKRTNYMYSPNPDLENPSSASKHARPSVPRFPMATVMEEASSPPSSPPAAFASNLTNAFSAVSSASEFKVPTRRSARVLARVEASPRPAARRVDTPRPKVQPKAGRATRSSSKMAPNRQNVS